MPIKKENRRHYGAEWKELSLRVRTEQRWLCFFCGVADRKYVLRSRATGRWSWLRGAETKAEAEKWAEELFPNWAVIYPGRKRPLAKIIRIILTVAHLNHDPTDNRRENLAGLCQYCHNKYDGTHRADNARRTRDRRRGQRHFGKEADDVETEATRRGNHSDR